MERSRSERTSILGRRAKWWRLMLIPALVSFSVFAEIIENPELSSRSMGAETLLFRWGAGTPYVEGGYNPSGTEYTLSGNGQGVYWCVDACGLAHVKNPPVRGDFTFTARIKEVHLPDNPAPAHIGIMVKGRLTAPAQVLALRWDTYWGNNGSGLTWFNRITPRDTLEILNADFAEKQCHGIGQGCRGYGFENVVPGFDKLEGLWLRVQRKVTETSDDYFLYARSDSSEDWRQISAIAGTSNACGNDPLQFVPSFDLGTFKIREFGNELYPALYVAQGSNGGGIVTATFDNISLEVDNPEEVHEWPSMEYAEDAVWWQSYTGPFSNFSTVSSDDYEIVDHLADARRVWKSEYIHPGRIDKGDRGNVWNAGIDTTLYDGVPSGGGASPVAADGKVYLYWYANNYDEATESWLETADDVIMCLDARDGSTLWKKVFPNAARDVAFEDRIGKSVMKNQTPCVYRGDLYVCNSVGKLYCLSAETGDVKWTSYAGGVPKTSALVCADGALVMGLGGCRACQDADLVAFACSSGTRLWRKADALGGAATPTKWTHDDEEYILAASATSREMRLIRPRTGEEVWKIADVGHNRYTVSANETCAIVNVGGQTDWGGSNDSGQIAGYRIGLSGAEKIWELPKRFGYGSNHIVLRDNIAYIPLSHINTFLAVDVTDGTIRTEYIYPRGSEFRSGWACVVDDRFMFELDGAHWNNETIQFRADPDSFEYLGAKWVPPHPNTTSYVNPLCRPFVDGRCFMRGYDAVYCYDFRKTGEPGTHTAKALHSRSPRESGLRISRFGGAIQVGFEPGPDAERTETSISIFDPTGRMVRRHDLSSESGAKPVRFNRLSPGMYIVELSNGSSRVDCKVFSVHSR